jgi:hypothetical protein
MIQTIDSRIVDTYYVPGGLTSVTASKGLKGRLGERMLGKDLVAGELVDTLGGVLVESLLVEENIPDTRGAVLRITVTVDVDVVLLRGCVSANEGYEIIRANSLVLEQVDKSKSIRVNSGQKASNIGLRTILAADKRANSGSERASDSSNVGTHLDKIGHSNLSEAVLVVVLVVNSLVVLSNLLETLVLTTSNLVRKDDRAIGAASLGRSLKGPGTSIVEANADCITSPSGATTSFTSEAGFKLVGDVLPDTACIALASLRVHRRAAKVAFTAGRVAVSLEDLLDITAD